MEIRRWWQRTAASPLCSVIDWEDDLSAKGLLPDFEPGCLLVGLATLEEGYWTSATGATKQMYPKLCVGMCQDRGGLAVATMSWEMEFNRMDVATWTKIKPDSVIIYLA